MKQIADYPAVASRDKVRAKVKVNKKGKNNKCMRIILESDKSHRPLSSSRRRRRRRKSKNTNHKSGLHLT
jgi:hypothetical protein